jgi:hypothetical protein
MSAKRGRLHWVPAWGAHFRDYKAPPVKTGCGRRLKGRADLVRAATSDRDFACDIQGRCQTCWDAWTKKQWGQAS